VVQGRPIAQRLKGPAPIVPILWRSVEELGCQPVDATGILAESLESSLVWHADAGERYEIGSHILGEISWASPGLELPDFLHPGTYDSPARYFARFRDAVVMPRGGIVMPRPGEILEDSARAIRWGSPRLQGMPGIVDLGADIGFDPAAAAAARVVEAPVMLLCHFAHRVYGHWLMDCLPGALRLRDALRASGRRLLTPPLASWQRAGLERIGLADLAEEVEDEILIARDILFPSHLDLAGVARPAAGIKAVFEALAGRSAGPRPLTPGLVYVSRQGRTGKRQMANEEELARGLEGLGFTISQPEHLSLDEQIELFAAADVVIGPHGSGLANVGFSSPGCVVIDLLLSSVPDPWICRPSAVLGHRYAYHLTEAEEMTRIDERGRKVARTDARYGVDVDRVLELASAAKRYVEESRRPSGP
jgi:capsular polysaccharide biosynthesis protein